MNSAALPGTSPATIEPSSWEEVRRIYRRVCVLRATGKLDEASNLEHGELPRALAAARLASDDATMEAAVLAEEAERIAAAHTLAELVAPMLADRLRAEFPPAAVRPPPTLRSPAPPAASPIAAPPAGEVPPIADLIDSMLSQQNNGPRRRGRPQH